MQEKSVKGSTIYRGQVRNHQVVEELIIGRQIAPSQSTTIPVPEFRTNSREGRV